MFRVAARADAIGRASAVASAANRCWFDPEVEHHVKSVAVGEMVLVVAMPERAARGRCRDQTYQSEAPPSDGGTHSLTQPRGVDGGLFAPEAQVSGFGFVEWTITRKPACVNSLRPRSCTS